MTVFLPSEVWRHPLFPQYFWEGCLHIVICVSILGTCQSVRHCASQTLHIVQLGPEIYSISHFTDCLIWLISFIDFSFLPFVVQSSSTSAPTEEDQNYGFEEESQFGVPTHSYYRCDNAPSQVSQPQQSCQPASNKGSIPTGKLVHIAMIRYTCFDVVLFASLGYSPTSVGCPNFHQPVQDCCALQHAKALSNEVRFLGSTGQSVGRKMETTLHSRRKSQAPPAPKGRWSLQFYDNVTGVCSLHLMPCVKQHGHFCMHLLYTDEPGTQSAKDGTTFPCGLILPGCEVSDGDKGKQLTCQFASCYRSSCFLYSIAKGIVLLLLIVFLLWQVISQYVSSVVAILLFLPFLPNYPMPNMLKAL